MGCHQSLCSDPGTSMHVDEYGNVFEEAMEGLADSKRRAIRAHRRRLEYNRAMAKSSLQRQGPSIYHADLGPLVCLPENFDPYITACGKYITTIQNDDSDLSLSDISSTCDGQSTDQGNGMGAILARRFGLDAACEQLAPISQRPGERKSSHPISANEYQEMLVLYALAYRSAPGLHMNREHLCGLNGGAKNAEQQTMLSGEASISDANASSFAWEDPGALNVSFRARARGVPSPGISSSKVDDEFDPTKVVNMLILDRLYGRQDNDMAMNEQWMIFQDSQTNPIKPTSFSWKSLRSSPNTEMHIDVDLSGKDGELSETTVRGRAVLPLDALSLSAKQNNYHDVGKDRHGERARIDKVLGLTAFDKWLPVRALRSTADTTPGDSKRAAGMKLGGVIGLVRIVAGRVRCTKKEGLALVRFVNAPSGKVKAKVKAHRAFYRKLAYELSLAVEGAVCVRAAVERVAVVKDGRAGIQHSPSRSQQIDEKNGGNVDRLPLLRRGPLFYDEFGFLVPSVDSPVNSSMTHVLRRQWLHFRDYHAQLSRFRSIEWAASEWSHDQDLVGADANKLLITSHASPSRIGNGTLSHSVSKSKDEDSKSDSAVNLKLISGAHSSSFSRSMSSIKLKGEDQDNLDSEESSIRTVRSRYASTPKLVMKAIASADIDSESSDMRLQPKDKTSKDDEARSSKLAASDMVSFHIVSSVDASSESNGAYQKHLASVIAPKFPSNDLSWDIRPLTGPNRAHTPSDVGHTYEELVEKMQLSHQSQDASSNPQRSDDSTEKEMAGILSSDLDSTSDSSRPASLSRGARLMSQRTIERTPAMTRMVWSGAVPMEDREDLYLRVSGASTRRLAEGVHYYSRLRNQVMLLFENNNDAAQLGYVKDRRGSVSSQSAANLTLNSTHEHSRNGNLIGNMDESVYFALRVKHRNLEVVMKQIDADVPRTFGGCRALRGKTIKKENVEQTTNMLRKRLGRVLKCYAMRNPSLGYCQSMNLVVGLFLSVGFSEEASFWLLTELAERIVPGYWVPSMTDTQIDTRTAVDLVRMRMGSELGRHLDELGVPLSVVVWQMILPLFISKGTTLAAIRLLDVIFYEGSSLAVLAFILALLEPWKEDLLEAEDLPDAMDVLMSAPYLLVDIDTTMQQAFDLLGYASRDLDFAPKDKSEMPRHDVDHSDDSSSFPVTEVDPSLTNHLVNTEDLDEEMSSLEQLRINMASLRKRHAMDYEPLAERSIRDAIKRRHLSTSGLDLEAFDQVYMLFVEESRIASSEHGIKDYRRLSSLESFTKVISAVAPGLVSTEELAANLFEAFDSDGTGSVDVDELFCGISILSPMGK